MLECVAVDIVVNDFCGNSLKVAIFEGSPP
jgi:hypothetical protein